MSDCSTVPSSAVLQHRRDEMLPKAPLYQRMHASFRSVFSSVAPSADIMEMQVANGSLGTAGSEDLDEIKTEINCQMKNASDTHEYANQEVVNNHTKVNGHGGGGKYVKPEPPANRKSADLETLYSIPDTSKSSGAAGKIMETLNNLSEKLPTNSKQGQNSTKKQQASVENPSYCLTNTSVEIRMAQAILDDDQLEIDSLLRQSLASKKTKISILLNTVSVQSLQAMFEEGKHATDFSKVESDSRLTQMNPVDLSIVFDRIDILDRLLDHGLTHIPRFDECLKDSNFVHSGHVFERLVRLSPKLAEDLLNHHLDGNHDDAEAAAPSVAMTLDFAPFDKTKVATPSCTSCRRDDRNESFSPLAMLADGHRDLIKNPLTEAFVSMKWQLFKWNYIVWVTFAVIHALVASLVVTFGVNPSQDVDYHLLVWLMVAIHTMTLISTLFRIARLRSKYLVSGWTKAQVKCWRGYRLIGWPVFNAWEALLEAALLCATLFYLLAQYEQFKQNRSVQVHVGSWMVLFAWLKVMATLNRSPTLGIYLYILRQICTDLLKFSLSILSLVVGLGLAYHTLLKSAATGSGAKFQAPLTSFWFALSLLGGHFDDGVYMARAGRGASVPPMGSMQLFFLAGFWTLSVGACNLVVGLSVSVVKEAMASAHDFRLDQMIRMNYEVEDSYLFLSDMLSCRGPHLRKVFSQLVTFMAKGRTVFGVRPGQEPVYEAVAATGCHLGRLTGYRVPAALWDVARLAVEEKHEDAKVREAERKKVSEGDYTSLYWNEDSASGENEYEDVEHCGDNNKTSGIRGLKESILKEIRKDFGRLMRPVGYSGSGGSKDSAKCVSVRPGLALGVITLQAGARGHNIAIH